MLDKGVVRAVAFVPGRDWWVRLRRLSCVEGAGRWALSVPVVPVGVGVPSNCLLAGLCADRLQTVRPDDHARVLRLLAKRHRDLGRQKNKTACRIHALLLDLTPGGVSAQITVTRANTILDTIETTDTISGYRVEVGRELVADMALYQTQMTASKQRIRTAVAASGTSLTEIYGCGPICAAMILGHTGDIERFATRAHYAAYNASAPIEVSSEGAGEARRGAQEHVPTFSGRSPESV